MSPSDFHPPRFDAPVDLDAQAALLPRGASCRGLFFLDTQQRLEAGLAGAPRVGRAPTLPDPRLAAIVSRRYTAFGDYPYEDYMRLQAYAARRLFPSQPLGEGLRRLGQGAYDALLASHVGRVIFGVFGRNFSLVARMGAKGWGTSMSFGSVEYAELGPGHGRYEFKGMPALLETLQVGVVEGAMRACGVGGRVWVRLPDPATATFELRWRA